jgi:transketolase
MNSSKVMPGQTLAMNASESAADNTVSIDKPFGQALIELARERDDIVALTADLGKYTDVDVFGEAFPDRYFQIGMAEQNLMGIAAGMANAGFTAFATTYCVFATRRAYDFIAIDLACDRSNVKIIAGLPGLTTGYGATHQGIDDLALMRAIPGLVVIDPCDATEIRQAVPVIAKHPGPVYMRLLRGCVKQVLDPSTYQFQIGKACVLRAARDLLFISTGLMTDRALEATAILGGLGINAGVLHVSTLKPFDSEMVVTATRQCPRVITLENHTVVGGLGSAVAEALCLAGVTAKLTKIGIPDKFVECGSVAYLTEKYGLSTHQICLAAEKFLREIR